MSIRLALSTTACPDWTLTQVIAQAKAMGYEGVDLATRFGRNTPEFRCDPQQGDASQIKDEFAKAGIAPVCLTTNLSLASPDDEHGKAAISMIRQAADRAAAIGAPAVRVLAYESPLGENPQNVMARVAKRVSEVVDYAGGKGVQLLFENVGTFTTARIWWWCLESIRHPMVGLVWNPAAAALAGEIPAVSVPMLNSRIRQVRLTDFINQPQQGSDEKVVTPVQLGDGELNVPKMLRRLMGVGFDGYVVVEWDRLHRPSLEEAETFLPEAQKRLSQWLTEIKEAGEPKKVVKREVPKRPAGGAAAKAPLDDEAKAKLKAAALAKAAAVKAAKAKAAQEGAADGNGDQPAVAAGDDTTKKAKAPAPVQAADDANNASKDEATTTPKTTPKTDASTDTAAS